MEKVSGFVPDQKLSRNASVYNNNDDSNIKTVKIVGSVQYFKAKKRRSWSSVSGVPKLIRNRLPCKKNHYH